MAPKDKMTEYERKRLENIRRNDEMMAALKIQSQVSLLSQSSKRQRDGAGKSKSYKLSPEKRPKPESPVVIRRSLRTQGLNPEGLDEPPNKTQKVSSSPKKPPSRILGPVSMGDAHQAYGSNQKLIDTLLSIDTKPQVSSPPIKDNFDGGNAVKEEFGNGAKVEARDGVFKEERKEIGSILDLGSVKLEPAVKEEFGNGAKVEACDGGIKEEKKEIESILDLGLMKLEPENIARVVPERIMQVKFLPCNDLRMVLAGDLKGNLGFWNMDSEDDDYGICLYRPHTRPISGIVFNESCFSKIYTSCYDGFIRMMDAEKQMFNLIHKSDENVYSLSRRPNDDKSLYFTDGLGGLTVWDEKMGKASAQWFPHENKIHTVHFNPQNPNIMVTGSTDDTARIWDLRNVSADKQPKCLHMISHNRSVQSAQFSPSGNSIATSSTDDTVGIHSGINFEENCMIPHNNQTGRWLSTFRAIWGWDDSYVFTGNLKKGVDVISAAQGRIVTTLESPEMTANSCRLDVHPCRVGMLAGSTGGGQVYVWTSS